MGKATKKRLEKQARTLSETLGDRYVIRAKYDAAQTTSDNMRHWANADNYSADAANSPIVRKTLRERARYEIANNSYAKGIIISISNALIGRGPRLQISCGDKALSSAIERDFLTWATEINLAAKLRTMKMAKTGDGEAFAQMVTNPKISNVVKLDIRLVECDQVVSASIAASENDIDGVVLDKNGNPDKYTFLRYHPGGGVGATQYVDIKSDFVFHWFRPDRPGQHRGVSELAPALPLFAQMRRYTQAVLDAAETAADFAAVIYSNSPAGEVDSVAPMDVFELQRRMATTLPQGWQIGQIKAEQPTNTYADFKHEIINEIARCLILPYNVAAGNSSGYNYASGRLDFQDFYRALEVERDELCNVVLRRLTREWLTEYMMAARIAIPMEEIKIGYMWDGQQHVDPAKEANAQSTRLASGTTNLANEYAREGKDWEEETREAIYEKLRKLQMIKEIANELGIDEKEALSYANGEPIASGGQPSDDDEE